MLQTFYLNLFSVENFLSLVIIKGSILKDIVKINRTFKIFALSLLFII